MAKPKDKKMIEECTFFLNCCAHASLTDSFFSHRKDSPFSRTNRKAKK